MSSGPRPVRPTTCADVFGVGLDELLEHTPAKRGRKWLRWGALRIRRGYGARHCELCSA
jgi:hypothetical protein